MRNLKRALSLALASVMLMGMMVVGTGAAFKDESKIENKEAATVLSALGVMVGTGDNFEPTANVTRAQMAQILCQATKVPAALIDSNKNTVVFDDVAAGKWYTGAIAVAAEKGWVAGYPDGNFGYNDTVTTAQAALMIQKALGYWAEADETEGNKISMANTLAYEIGMMDDLTLLAGAGLSRDNVAGMLYNAMTNTVPVVYSKDVGYLYVVGSGTSVTDPTDDQIKANCLFAKFIAGSAATDEDYVDAMGRPGTEYTYNDAKIVVMDTATAIYTAPVTSKDLYKDMSKKVGETGATVTKNAVAVTGSFKTAIFGDETVTDSTKTVDGLVIEVYNTDTKTTYVAYNYNYGIIDEVTASKADSEGVVTTTVKVKEAGATSVTAATTFTTTNAFDLKKGDLVTYLNVADVAAATGVEAINVAADSMEIAKTVAGEITAISTDKYIRLNGTMYNVATAGLAIADKGVVVLDENGFAMDFIGNEPAGASDNYALVTAIRWASDAATGKTAAYADLILADGSKVTVSLDMSTDAKKTLHAKLNDTIGVADDYAKCYITTYAENDGLYTLETTRPDMSTSVAADAVTIKNSDRTFDSTTADAGLKTVYVNIADGVAYTGIEEVPTYKTGAKAYYVKDTDGVATYVFITAGTLDAVSADAEYIYIKDYTAVELAGTGSNATWTYTEVYVDGVKTDLVCGQALASVSNGLKTIATKDANGNVMTVTNITPETAAFVNTVTSGAMYLAQYGDTIKYDSKTTFIKVAKDNAISAASASDIVTVVNTADKTDATSVKYVLASGSTNYAEYVIITVADFDKDA